jgi:DNA invertase Pin-like site-specific DNA recombinase
MAQGLIYTRVSSDEQVKGTSLRSQEELCRKYCEERGIEVLQIFREEGESAKTADRTELLKAIEFCRRHRGEVQAFIVAKVDRFARNAEDHLFVRKRLLEYGVALHSVTEPIGNSPTGKFVETVLAASAEFDNAIRKQRSTDGMASRLAQGIWPWKPPPGYLSTGCKKRGEKKTRPNPRNSETFPLIQRVLRELASGRIGSMSEAARALNAWGLARIRGRTTLPQFVDGILRNSLKFYAGLLVNPWTGEEHAGLHEPMITIEELGAIQLIRTGRRAGTVVAPRSRWNPLFPLRHTARCSRCYGPLTGSLCQGRRLGYPYYYCLRRSCEMRGKTIPKGQLEAAFSALLNRIALTPRFLQALRAVTEDSMETQGDSLAAQLRRIDEKLAVREERRRTIFDMREDGTYTKEVFRERLLAIEADIAALRNAAGALRPVALSAGEAIECVEKVSRDLPSFWFALAPQHQPRLQRLVLPSGVAYDRENGFDRTPELGLLFALQRDSRGDISRLVTQLRDNTNTIMACLQEFLKLKTLLASDSTTDGDLGKEVGLAA